MSKDASGDLMVKSDYGQVVFELADTYPINSDVECRYRYATVLTPAAEDWVGLFKVGWTNAKDHVAYVPAELQQGDKELHIVVFSAKQLPRDDGEFYQFVYVSDGGIVRGASMPFQFRDPSCDFVELEDDDVLVVRSRSALTEEKLRASFEETAALRISKEVLEEELQQLESKLRTKDLDIIKLQGKCKEIEIDSVAALEKKNCEIQQLKEQHADIEGELESLKEQINEAEACKSRLQETVKNLSAQRDARDAQLECVKNETERLQSCVQEMEEKHKNSEDKLEALEECKRRLTEDIRTYEVFKAKISSDLEKATSRAADATKHNAELQQLLNEANRQKSELQKSYDELAKAADCSVKEYEKKSVEFHAYKTKKEQETAGAEYAFAQFKVGMEAKHKDMQEKQLAMQEELNKMKKLQQEKIDLERDNEDMRERLAMARTEFENKYKECEKLRIKNERLMKKTTARDLGSWISVTTEIDPDLVSSSFSDNFMACDKCKDRCKQYIREIDHLKGTVQMLTSENDLIKESLEKTQVTLNEKLAVEKDLKLTVQKLQTKNPDETEVKKKSNGNDSFVQIFANPYAASAAQAPHIGPAGPPLFFAPGASQGNSRARLAPGVAWPQRIKDQLVEAGAAGGQIRDADTSMTSDVGASAQKPVTPGVGKVRPEDDKDVDAGEDEFFPAEEDFDFADLTSLLSLRNGQSSLSNLVCPECRKKIDCSTPQAIDEHVKSHGMRICPVCDAVFYSDKNLQTYIDHVQGHFVEEDRRK